MMSRIHQAGKPAVVNMGVNTNPDISATCTVTADGGILPLYFIYSESQIKHTTGNAVKQQKQAHITNKMSVNGTNNSMSVSDDHNHQVNCHNSTTNNIHIHIPDTGKHGNFYTTAKCGSN